MFPFRPVVFAPRFKTVDLHFVTSDNVMKRRDLPHNTGTKGGYGCLNFYAYIVLLALSERILYKLYVSEMRRERFQERNFD